MQNLTITVVQADLVWENPASNRAQLDATLRNHLATQQTDIIVLPEMFTTGFSMNTAYAESETGETVAWMRQQAKTYQAVVTGSLMIAANGGYFNRLIWMPPHGDHQHYDKRHLFGLAQEDQHFTAGTHRLVVEWKGWRVCPLICYDLRFPVWSRNVGSVYDLLLYVANWPQKRVAHWRTLALARAIENQCYVAAVNRFGTDGVGFYYTGHTAVISPLGDYLYEVADRPDVYTTTLSADELRATRTRLPFLKDAAAWFLPNNNTH